jgi:hypothetical protein
VVDGWQYRPALFQINIVNGHHSVEIGDRQHFPHIVRGIVQMDFRPQLSNGSKQPQKPAGDESDTREIERQYPAMLAGDQSDDLLPTRSQVDTIEHITTPKADNGCGADGIDIKDCFAGHDRVGSIRMRQEAFERTM